MIIKYALGSWIAKHRIDFSETERSQEVKQEINHVQSKAEILGRQKANNKAKVPKVNECKCVASKKWIALGYRLPEAILSQHVGARRAQT